MFYGTKISGHYAGRDGNVDVNVDIVWSNGNGSIKGKWQRLYLDIYLAMIFLIVYLAMIF
jgi:hypothetical protein